MRTRMPILVTATLVAASLAVAPALATEASLPSALQAAPSISALEGVLNHCHDSTKPRGALSARWVRVASRTRMLRGSARDSGCGVALVTVSVARAHGKRCEYLSAKGRLSRSTPCKHDRWLLASGTRQWRLQLPKALPRGTYLVRTRAVDFAGNVEAPRTQRLKLG
jgi:hypothetical protein